MVIEFYPVNKPRTAELLDSLINVWERAETDELGNPFPILKMKL